jgi:hypothetical protein
MSISSAILPNFGFIANYSLVLHLQLDSGQEGAQLSFLFVNFLASRFKLVNTGKTLFSLLSNLGKLLINSMFEAIG